MRVTQKYSLYFAPATFAVLLCTCSVWGQQDTAVSDELDAGQVAALDLCIEKTFADLTNASTSTCKTDVRYFAAGGGGHVRVKIRFDVPKNYDFVRGTERATQIGGLCEHNLYANWQSTKRFECEWETSGCGSGRGGGHVRGFCSISIRYVPQRTDIVVIKEYCLNSILGGTAPKPSASPVGCRLY